MLDNGRYVLTVDKSASLADVLPEDAEINFDTKIRVNHQAAKAWTRAGGTNAVEDMSARYMEGDTIHPAVILYTDNGGAGEDVQVTEDMALARSQFTRAPGRTAMLMQRQRIWTSLTSTGLLSIRMSR